MAKSLDLNSPAKFKALTPLKIYRGVNLFYRSKKNKTFTLPIGNYEIEGKFLIIERPFFREVNFPEMDHFKNKNYQFNYGVNPNKASVWDNGFVLIDKDFANMELLDLILKLHEIGHSFYKSELNCDKFAVECLKVLGYNDSQIIAGFATIGKTDRHYCLHKYLKK